MYRMKIAVLSDIHGNLAALEAVLADARSEHVDLLINLGDICSGPLFPSETADLLMALGFPTIRGNHERQVLEPNIDAMGPSDRYAALALRPNHLTWLAALPPTRWLNEEVLMVHGTPDSDLSYFLETVTPVGLRPATAEEVEERAGRSTAKLILCGHTHIPRTITLANGRIVVNPGSVGLPAYDDDRPYPHVVENGSPHARYAIVTRAKECWQADLRVVEYNWEGAARQAEANDRPDWARALRTGYA